MPSILCPRCGSDLLPPTLTQHQYRCPTHGEVPGIFPAAAFVPAEVPALARRSEVALWYPAPMPDAWTLTGMRWAQSPRGRACAIAVAVTGRALAEGPTDVLVVAEVRGCGLGAMYAGLSEPDPGPRAFDGPAAARIHAGHRATGLWSVATPDDRVAFVGEADGAWLWIIGWPASAWSLVADDLRLADGRIDDSYRRYVAGALSPRLAVAGRGDGR